MSFYKRHTFSPLICCALASEIVLFNGDKGLTQEAIDRSWKHDEYPPSIYTVTRLVKKKNIKWYIRNLITIDDKVWNGDFLSGLAVCGKINWYAKSFPTLKWIYVNHLKDIFLECPFYGIISTKPSNKANRWYNVPALYLRSSVDSISFMAGVLATGTIEHKDGLIYACYSGKVTPYLEKWGIPIEHKTKANLYVMISPIWPALFTGYMPECCGFWNNIKDGIKTNHYATMLWRMYVSNDIVRNGLPYLKSRRWVYNRIGTVESTERLWITSGLTQLDNRIKSVVRLYSKNV